MVARVFGAFFALVLAAISLGALATPVLLRVGLHPTMLVYGVGIPALCLLALPSLVRADRTAAVKAALIAPARRDSGAPRPIPECFPSQP